MCFANLDWTHTAKDLGEYEFMETKWAPLVSANLGVPEADLNQLLTTKDTHSSDMRTRENWKYAASIGMSGTPQGYVNGVKIDNYPESVADWVELLDSITAPASAAASNEFILS